MTQLAALRKRTALGCQLMYRDQLLERFCTKVQGQNHHNTGLWELLLKKLWPDMPQTCSILQTEK
jgi:hypothetical protein